MEEALRKIREELEQTLEERTRELSKINEELKNKKENIEEINTALKVLLQRRDEDKATIEKKLLVLSHNCQFDSKFWIRPDEAYAFLVNTHPKCSPGIRMQP